METRAFRWFGVAAGLLLLGIPLSGQAGKNQVGKNIVKTSPANASPKRTRLGYPQDWSSRHFLMPGVRPEDLLAEGSHDPRLVHNMVMRQVALRNAHQAEEDARIEAWQSWWPPFGRWQPWRPPQRILRRKMKIDWAVSLENGYVPQKQFPAKYQFDVTAGESCSSDYVLYGLTVTSGTQANLVGINNLYTEAIPACDGNLGQPLVAFAYNTQTNGGQIVTSPTLSEDGTKVAFVESTASGAYFHVLVLPNPIPATSATAVGTVLSPVIPDACTDGDPTTASCMTTLAINTAATDSNSSVWVDYNTDTAYVGTDDGTLFKIAPVFLGGAPALVNDPTNWPVTLIAPDQTNNIPTDPVVDYYANRIFIGNGSGYLFAVDMTNPLTTYAAEQGIGWIYDGDPDGSGGPGTGVVDAPIVVLDAANPTVHQVFAFTGCSSAVGIGGAITQLPVNFTTPLPDGTLTTGTSVNLGSASGGGIGDCTGNNVHSGTVDNAFWLTGSTNGHMIACGFVDGGLVPSNPQIYMFPFDTSGQITSVGQTGFVVNGITGEECSPLTEFYNGTTDMLFFGVGGAGTPSFLESSTLSATSLTTPLCTGAPTSTCVTTPNAPQGTSGIIIDNQSSNGGTNIYFTTQAPGDVNSQQCNVAGGTATPYCAVKLTQSGLN
jgi:hypothetical protein